MRQGHPDRGGGQQRVGHADLLAEPPQANDPTVSAPFCANW